MVEVHTNVMIVNLVGIYWIIIADLNVLMDIIKMEELIIYVLYVMEIVKLVKIKILNVQVVPKDYI